VRQPLSAVGPGSHLTRHAGRLLEVPLQHALAISLCGGLTVSLAMRASGAAPIIVAAAVAAAATGAPARYRLPLLVLALVMAGWWWGSARLSAIDASVLTQDIGASVPLRAEVTGPARGSAYTLRIPVRVREVKGEAVDEAAQLELPAEAPAPRQGAIVELVAGVRAPKGPEEERGFDEASYLHRRGMHVVLRADRYAIVGRRGGVGGVADRIRAMLATSISPGLEGERKALVAAVVLGEDEGLPAELRDRFRTSGLYHLLAVSGQNVAYIAGGVLLTAWLAGIPRILAQVVALLAILAYVLAVGWQPSVVRAGVVGCLACLAWIVARGRDRWYFMLVGAGVLLAWSPYALLDPGFQLSFAAVGAIFLLVPRIERRLEGYPLPKAVATVIAVSIACSLVTAPVLWLRFGAVPVLSILANGLAAPVVAPILGFGLVAAALEPLLPGAAVSLAWANGWLVSYLAWCARAVGGLPFAQITSGAVLAAGAVVSGFAVLVWRVRRGWRRPLLIAGAALCVAVAAWTLWPRASTAIPPTGLRVSFLDVGQGDSVLLEVPEGAVLVDEGPPEARVADQLRGRGLRRLDLVVLTHPQRDHIGGAADVIRKLAVEAALDPRQPNESPYEDEALEAAADRGVAVRVARAGQVFQLGRLTLRILWPDAPGFPGQDPNEHAVVLLASYGAVDVLLTADAESPVTNRLAIPPVEILKVAHHGSADRGLQTLVERLQPRVAVISVGAHNDYGHPTPSTLAVLEHAEHLDLYRTDVDGTVIVESDGSSIQVRSDR
jgi:competence protein ComEC